MTKATAQPKQKPAYLDEVKNIVSNNKVYPLKKLFLEIRKDYPEVDSMRNLKEDIETYMDGFKVSKDNLIISKKMLLSEIMSIIAN